MHFLEGSSSFGGYAKQKKLGQILSKVNPNIIISAHNPPRKYTALLLPAQGRHLLEKTSQCLPCRGRLVSQATT